MRGNVDRERLARMSDDATRVLGFPVDYNGIDVDVVAEIDAQLRRLVREHPVLRHVIPAVRTNPRMLPGMPMGYNEQGIGLNQRELSGAASTVRNALEQASRNGLHPPACDSVTAGISHEVAEALDAYISAGRAGTEAAELLAEWKRRTPYDGLGRYVRAKRRVSGDDERFQTFMASIHTPDAMMGDALRVAVGGVRRILAGVDRW